MKRMSERAILLLAGVVMAYFAIYFGDGVYAKVMADWVLPIDAQSGWLNKVIIPCFIIGILGFASCINALHCMLSNSRKDTPEAITVYAAFGLVCLALIFGVVAGPFSNYGAYPWDWTSRWNWLLIPALIPTVLVAKGLLSEAIVTRRDRKTMKNKD